MGFSYPAASLLDAAHGRAPGCPWWGLGGIISNVPSDRQFKRLCNIHSMICSESQRGSWEVPILGPPLMALQSTGIPKADSTEVVFLPTQLQSDFVHSLFHALWGDSISSVLCVATTFVSTASSIPTLLRGNRKMTFPVKLLPKSFKVVRINKIPWHCILMLALLYSWPGGVWGADKILASTQAWIQNFSTHLYFISKQRN